MQNMFLIRGNIFFTLPLLSLFLLLLLLLLVFLLFSLRCFCCFVLFWFIDLKIVIIVVVFAVSKMNRFMRYIDALFDRTTSKPTQIERERIYPFLVRIWKSIIITVVCIWLVKRLFLTSVLVVGAAATRQPTTTS